MTPVTAETLPARNGPMFRHTKPDRRLAGRGWAMAEPDTASRDKRVNGTRKVGDSFIFILQSCRRHRIWPDDDNGIRISGRLEKSLAVNFPPSEQESLLWREERPVI